MSARSKLARPAWILAIAAGLFLCWLFVAQVREHNKSNSMTGLSIFGGQSITMEPPSDEEVLQALEQARPTKGAPPLLPEFTRKNVRIVKEKIADYVDPPRLVPLVGPSQLRHAHYKCTVYFTQVTRMGWPAPQSFVDDNSVEKINIHRTKLQKVGNVDTKASSPY